MKPSNTEIRAALGALVLLPGSHATHAHRHLHQHFGMQHTHLHVRHTDEAAPVAKRGTCAFPGDEDPNLVAVTPGEMNAGWAMSPDQPCEKDSYCPYACKPGMVMAQWDPKSKFEYPLSMNGGLYCDENGEISKPFPNKPYCVDGTGTVKAVNKCGKKMSWCQTVLPGNEAMLIPTEVSDMATLAVPDPSYWESTAAHFYINPPGSSSDDCVWGDDSKNIGNWSPYVAGANTDGNGQTFVKLGWNPIYESSSLSTDKIDFGVKVECPDGNCNGTPCAIDPSKGTGLVDSLLGSTGAGGSDFCVVTVPKGSTANIIAFSLNGGDSGSDEEEEEVKEPEEEEDDDELGVLAAQAVEETSQAPTTTAEPTVDEAPTTVPKPTTTSAPPAPTSTESSTSSTSKKSKPTVNPGIFQEHRNDTATETDSSTTTLKDSESSSGTAEEPAATSDETDGAGRQSSPTIAGLLVAFVAAACFF
ncbi:secreted beta-glucosidase-like protein [Hapsidospora chrysogenum ATCC 11550]|uniref:Secreted beta-glucosidase-like protein n=1 Tax=Hapsidospora chrysogenum (strain ATCC 11550 / CBS 779.69 / DSM 880 / IAM 14645 / JCM 23072 / IMI 49137) TaxID=857340 RepID=A0A086TEI1_HAPC1|nr:secreted beta-glucosidase-like protein [Hapsidospora chrysogenum ATCC 11550]